MLFVEHHTRESAEGGIFGTESEVNRYSLEECSEKDKCVEGVWELWRANIIKAAGRRIGKKNTQKGDGQLR